MSLQNIFAKPQFVEGVGNIYPIQLKDWDEFEQYSGLLIFDKKDIPEHSTLLDELLLKYPQQEIVVLLGLMAIFKMILQVEKLELIEVNSSFAFKIDEERTILPSQYQEIRDIIVRQNVILLPKIYKSKMMQEWAEKALQARQKNAPKMTLEDMISTVSMAKGVHYWDLEKYTMYQLKTDFERYDKMMDFETSSLVFANPYADLSKVKLPYFAESFDLYKSPYDGLFKDKSKLNISKAIQE